MDQSGSLVHNLKRKEVAHGLTLRQKEVLQLLVEGRSMKEAAFILKVSPRTVAFHKYTMMEVLSLHSSAELIRYGMNNASVAA
jgi:DNA-binding CsgD family transcriptional regulator